MEVVHRRCAGIDIAKKSATVCVRVQGSGRRATQETVRTWGSMTNQILALRDHLVDAQITCAAMEATGDYWKPFYYLLEGAGFEVMLVNARQVKNVPGRKTDVIDAAWLAQLAAHRLVRPCLVPPPQIRQLRDLTRTRTALTRDRSRELQRLEKLLEDAGIKLSAVVSELGGVSALAMVRALIAGQRDPEVVADLAKGHLRPKIPQLVEALNGRFSDHHAFLAQTHLTMIEHLSAAIEQLNQRIATVMEPFRAFADLIASIPGCSRTVAQVVIAETTGDMSLFPTPGDLAAWAGVAPGQYQSAGRNRSSRTRRGDAHLKGALGIAALSIARSHKSRLSVKYQRLASRRGASRAIVAIEHTLLTIIWTMYQTGEYYQDLGTDHYLQRDPERTKRQALRQLASLGYEVTLSAA